MFSSLRARLWLSYAFLIVTALAVVAIVLMLFLLRNPYLYRQTVLRLGVAEAVLRRTPLAGGEVTSVAQEFNVRALVFSSDGVLIEDSEAGAAEIGLPVTLLVPRALATARDQAGKLWLYTLSRRADGAWLLVAAPRPGLAPLIAVVTDELARPILQGGLIALLLALVLAYGLARWIADPLQRLIAAARQFAVKTGRDGFPTVGATNPARPVPEGGPHEVRELTQAFNAMVARVQASQRSQRDLVANVCHELKTPLTSIQGFAQALLEGAADTPSERQHAAEVIHDEAGRMDRMVVDLPDLAQLDAGTADLQVSAVDPGALLMGIVDRFRPMASAAGVELGLEIASGMPTFAGDGDRLAQVFANLLDNALKFTPRNGRIEVKARAQDDEVLVSVMDTGAGIANEDIPHIFDRFYQADAAREGGEKHAAGLGLAIVHEIVSDHGGRISVRSTPERGTEFTVHLPVHSGIRQA
jgi:two-component system OmpR family sensor kinase